MGHGGGGLGDQKVLGVVQMIVACQSDCLSKILGEYWGRIRGRVERFRKPSPRILSLGRVRFKWEDGKFKISGLGNCRFWYHESVSRVRRLGKEALDTTHPRLLSPPPGDRKKTWAPQQALRPGPTPTSSPCQLSEMPCSEWAGPSL